MKLTFKFHLWISSGLRKLGRHVPDFKDSGIGDPGLTERTTCGSRDSHFDVHRLLTFSDWCADPAGLILSTTQSFIQSFVLQQSLLHESSTVSWTNERLWSKMQISLVSVELLRFLKGSKSFFVAQSSQKLWLRKDVSATFSTRTLCYKTLC